VGFIRHLPHKLVEAFRATLEEAASADLLLHVIDAHDEERALNVEQVELVLQEIGASELPVLEVYNKIDLLPDAEPRIEYSAAGKPVRVWLSAQENVGLDGVLEAVVALLAEDIFRSTLTLAPDHGRLRSRLYACGAVLDETYNDQGHAELSVEIPKADLLRMLSAEAIDAEAFLAAQGSA